MDAASGRSAERIMRSMLIALCATALTYENYAAGNGLLPLTDGGDLPAQVLQIDDEAVTFKGSSGVERIPWWELDLGTADHIGRNSGQFIVLDRRTFLTNDVRLTRAIVSRRFSSGALRYYIHGRYTSPKRSGIQNAGWLYAETPPSFIDDNTILIIPNHILLAYRDFDADHLPEEVTIQRPSSYTGNKLVDNDPENKAIHDWRVSFDIGDQAYFFSVRSKTLPPPPEPCEGQVECVTINGQKRRLADLRAGQTTVTILPDENDNTESQGNNVSAEQ